MRTNHAPGPLSSRTARSHGRRNIAADTRTRASRAPSGAPLKTPSLPSYFRPLLLPDAVVHTAVFAVVALRDRRLPELDRVEVRRRRVRVVDRARALLDPFHFRARELVHRRLAVGNSLWGLDLRGRDVVQPFVRAVRMRRVRREHPRV